MELGDRNLIDPRVNAGKYYQQTSFRFMNATFDFQPTRFIVDVNYVGLPPETQVCIENLNDNIDENFLRRDLKNYRLKTLEIVRHPISRQHLGLAKIQFEESKDAAHCVETFNGKQVMGKRLSVYLDVKFELIERKRLEILNPKPLPIVTPVVERLPTISPLTPSSITTASTAFALDGAASRGRLEDRIAILMRQPGCVLSSIPGLPSAQPQHKSPPALNQAFQPNNEINKPYDPPGRNINHINKSYERPNDLRKQLSPAQPTSYPVEDEKAWNPEPRKEEKEETLPPNLVLTATQIDRIVTPFCFEKFFEEIRDNLHQTIRRKLTTNHGYPAIDKARSEHQSKLDEIRRSNEARLQSERQKQLNRDWERKFMTKDRIENAENISRPRANLIRQRTNVFERQQENRKPVFDLKRVNRSSALVNEPDRRESRHASVDSHSIASSSSRRSRSYSRAGSSSRSSSASSTSSSSSASSSSSSSSSSRSSSSLSSARSFRTSPSASRDSIINSVDRANLSSVPKSSITIARPDEERRAVEALLQLQTVDNSRGLFDDRVVKKEKTVAKKRKLKEEPILPSPKKVRKEDRLDDTKPVALMNLGLRDRKTREKLLNDIRSINDEDIEYLKAIHDKFGLEPSGETSHFGSMQANRAHLVNLEELNQELKKSKHPRWWNGCSRCSIIVSSEKGLAEEPPSNTEDLTKSPIKSHVIQAANSTRRDQKSDQRRLAILNPDIAPDFLKHFTSNTLQMRAKNLRFSRSKIHKWGLFACEKIANGDAVIEYVGEKIRPSLADHREKFVYTNLPTHDGSSYFFRVDTDVIDATLKGNKARFINHCCNPNCIAKVIKHDNGSNSIVIYAKQQINEDEEITYDYKFPREEQKIRCECRAPNCQGFLN